MSRVDIRDQLRFKGYWSESDKTLWKNIDWEKRDYEDFPVELDNFNDVVYFCDLDGVTTKKVTFVKMLHANPIYAPYYAPVMTKELRDTEYYGPMYDGRTINGYPIHDRYESEEIYDMLSR